VPRAAHPTTLSDAAWIHPLASRGRSGARSPPHVAGYSSVADDARGVGARGLVEGKGPVPRRARRALSGASRRQTWIVTLRVYVSVAISVRSTPRGASRACLEDSDDPRWERPRQGLTCTGYGRAIVAVLFIYFISRWLHLWWGARLVHARGSSCPEIGASNAVYGEHATPEKLCEEWRRAGKLERKKLRRLWGRQGGGGSAGAGAWVLGARRQIFQKANGKSSVWRDARAS